MEVIFYEHHDCKLCLSSCPAFSTTSGEWASKYACQQDFANGVLSETEKEHSMASEVKYVQRIMTEEETIHFIAYQLYNRLGANHSGSI